jgi:Holliday junction resolvase RusA-like endonuclease
MFIPIKAIGKERPRYSSWAKCHYTPKKTKDFENVIADYTIEYMNKHNMDITEEALALEIIVYHKVPKSWKKDKQEEAIKGLLKPIKTPDLDNIIKAIQDGMQKVAFIDDKQICEIYARRFYSKEDSIFIDFKVL